MPRPRRATRPHLDSILGKLWRAHVDRMLAREHGRIQEAAERKIASLVEKALLQGITPIELNIALKTMDEQTSAEHFRGLSKNRCPSCGGVSHPASGSALPSGEVVCGPCVRRFWKWAAEHGERRYRVGSKGKGARYIAFPTGVERRK